MSLILNNKGIASMTFNGKKVKECWFNGVKVWPNYPDLDPIVAQIATELNVFPIHYCKFNETTAQTPLVINGVTKTPAIFHTTPNAPTYDEGIGGRKAIKCSYVNISLAAAAKGTRQVFISMLIKQTTTNSTYAGVIGGTIFGLNTKGFGYALGWAPSIQSNKFCAESYAGGGAAAAYSPIAMTTNKWYHVMIEFRAPITAVGYGTPTSWISINGSAFVQANGAGTLGSTLDYSDLSENGDTYIHLGCTWQSGQKYFKGLIQDFILFEGTSPSDAHIELLKNYYKELGVY